MAESDVVRRFRGIVEYDGTEYHGFQIQPDKRTIQGEIESVLKQITGGQDRAVGPRVIAAGRTDSGVHALGQVVHFDCDWSHSERELWKGLNALLPFDIAFRELRETTRDFHARYDAKEREYIYRVLNEDLRSPLRERFTHRIVGPVGLQAMNLACESVVGTHDFAAFGQPTTGEVTLRTVIRAIWVRVNSELRFEIVANSFLRHMVRRLVGTLLAVGKGTITPEEFADILATADISRSAPPVPGRGLCLVRVSY